MFDLQKITWVDVAESLKPTLHSKVTTPQRLVSVYKSDSGLQGWAVESSGSPIDLTSKPLHKGDSFILDFGIHTVGFLKFKVSTKNNLVPDAPLRLKIIFGEVPAEVIEPFDPYAGTLGRGWLQDEIITVDVLPAFISLPRRYAFQYVKFEVIDTSSIYEVIFSEIQCETVTSADIDVMKHNTIPDSIPQQLKDLDRVSLQTLCNCMQTVFEDGPKRDRRLWLGDLRLEAITNYVSFKNYDLVKRCLYLFAGLVNEEGLIPACIFEMPVPTRSTNYILDYALLFAPTLYILDYALLFAPTLLDYAKASQDWGTLKELWSVARRQLDFGLQYVNTDGIFVAPGNWWLFVDWEENLDKQTSIQGIIIYCLRQLLEIAEILDMKNEMSFLNDKIFEMTSASQNYLRDKKLFFSGNSRQISWASQAWMTISGVMNSDEAASAFKELNNHINAIKPAGPYLYHHVIEAMISCGLKSDALSLLETYWGGMLKYGVTTFWEVYDPNSIKRSPYNSHLLNSYCHAWSCTPSYFIRKFFCNLSPKP